MVSRLRITSLLLAALALFATPAAAFELADGKLDVAVSGEAAYGRTDGNTYAQGNEAGQYDNTTLGLAFIGHVSDQLTIAARFDLEGGEEMGAEIDWAFAEWKVSDAFRFRAGKGKHPFGNYGETVEEGTLRPFFAAPTVIYGPSELVGDGYTGAGVTGFFRLGEAWGLTYDVYAGELDVDEINTLDLAVDPLAPPLVDEDETRELLGGRLSIETPITGLTARLSAYTGVTTEEGRRTAAALSGEYLDESLSLRAEYAMLVEEDLTSNAAYVEAAWLFKNGFQLAGRVEGSWTDLDGGSGPYLRHQEAALGVNYWFTPDFVIKASAHLVDGNRFAVVPWDGDPLTTRPEPDEATQLYVIAAQFRL